MLSSAGGVDAHMGNAQVSNWLSMHSTPDSTRLVPSLLYMLQINALLCIMQQLP
jgi:hypothetical protein